MTDIELLLNYIKKMCIRILPFFITGNFRTNE